MIKKTVMASLNCVTSLILRFGDTRYITKRTSGKRAGMPTIDDQGNAIYSMDAKSFAEHMKVLIENGASVVGGCCGTTPEFIREISRSLGR